MKIKKRVSALLFTLIMCFASSTAVHAHEVPDVTRTGSITAVMAYDGENVGGGSLTLYRTGDVSEDDGNYSFTLTDEFMDSAVSLDNVSDADLARNLAEYAEANGLEGTTVQIGNDGTATADDLTPGLYLVVQNEAADGFETISPFLVSLPMYENGVYVYDVNVEPKMGTLTTVTPDTPAAPDTSADAGSSVSSGTSSVKTLPQTGQLNWPIPVLTAAGLCLLFAGQWMRSGKENYEA